MRATGRDRRLPGTRPVLTMVLLGLFALLAVGTITHHAGPPPERHHHRAAVRLTASAGHSAWRQARQARTRHGAHAQLARVHAPSREAQQQDRVPPPVADRRAGQQPVPEPVWLAAYPPGPDLCPQYVLPAPGGRAPPATVA